MLDENYITDLLEAYFINNDYQIVNKLTTIQRGIDLVVKDKYGISIYIEIKGQTSSISTSKRYGKPFDADQINNHVGRALLATFKAMNRFTSKNDKFAIAFPDTPSHEKVLNHIKSTLGKLNVIIYLVSDKRVRIL